MYAKKKKILYWTMALGALLIVLPLLATMALYNRAFGTRVENSAQTYEFLRRKYPAFRRSPHVFSSNRGQSLQGYFYDYPGTSPKGLIVMAHGMGGGHDSYLVETEYLARNGYLLFAYDSTGTNESGGTRLVGLSQAPIDLHHALLSLESFPDVQGLPLLLYGHSWGGFAVAAVSCFPHSVQGIVSVSGFTQSQNVLLEQGRTMVGNWAALFTPYAGAYERLLFGRAASYTGISGLSQTDAPVLIIHSDDDRVVNYQENYGAYRKAFKNDPRFTFVSLTQHGHNAVLSPAANAAIARLQEQKRLHAPESWEYKQLDAQEKELTLELDSIVMGQVLAFFDQICKPDDGNFALQ